MATTKIQSIEDVKALANNKFHVLKPCDKRKGNFNLSLQIDSYIELHFLILDIVKVSLAALDAENEEVTDVKNTNNAVRGVLQFVLQMVPLEEMDFLDKIREMILADEQKEI